MLINVYGQMRHTESDHMFTVDYTPHPAPPPRAHRTANAAPSTLDRGTYHLVKHAPDIGPVIVESGSRPDIYATLRTHGTREWADDMMRNIHRRLVEHSAQLRYDHDAGTGLGAWIAARIADGAPWEPSELETGRIDAETVLDNARTLRRYVEPALSARRRRAEGDEEEQRETARADTPIEQACDRVYTGATMHTSRLMESARAAAARAAGGNR